MTLQLDMPIMAKDFGHVPGSLVPRTVARLGEKAWVRLLGIAPLRAYTWAIGAAASVPLPKWSRVRLLGGLARRTGVDLSEAELDISQYRTFQQLFVRRLKPGLRPIDASAGAVVSPVDGCVSAVGMIERGRLLQAKSLDYSVAELLGDERLAELFEGGCFATLYLRPSDYHRIHAPAEGRITRYRRIAGRLFPVQPVVVRNLRGLFVRNERVVLEIESPDLDRVVLVCVGATAVGAVSTVFPSTAPGGHAIDPPYRCSRGEEIAAFNLGSTVIVMFRRGRAAVSELSQGDEVRVGQPIAWRDAS